MNLSNSEKITLIREGMSKINDVEAISEGNYFGGIHGLKFRVSVDNSNCVYGLFTPEHNTSILLINTDESFTDAQWIYLCKQINDTIEKAYQSKLIKTFFYTHFDKKNDMLIIEMPAKLDGSEINYFDIDEQIQALKDISSKYMICFYQIVSESLKLLNGIIPSPMYSPSTLVVKKKIENKEDLLLTTQSLFMLAAGEDNDSSVYAIMSLHDMSVLFKEIMKDYPECEHNIMMGIKEYYSPSTWFTLSKEGQRNFFIDLRKKFI